MTGFILIGTILSTSNKNEILSINVFLLAIGAFCLTFSIYSCNSYLGLKYDLNNPRLRFLSSNLSRPYLISTTLTLSITLTIFFYLNKTIGGLALVTFIMWILYSSPKIGVKGIPIVGTIVHFISQVLYFHIGYFLLAPFSTSSFLISLFFSFLFAAGHILHEAMDYDSDVKENINTGASLWGKKNALIIGHYIFLLALIIWTFLLYTNIISQKDYMPFAACLILQIMFYIFLFIKKEVTIKRLLQYQQFYRSLYLIAGIFLFFFRYR